MSAQSPLAFLNVLTPQLRALVEHYRVTLSPANFDSFVRHLERLCEGYRASIAGVPAGSERARAVHVLMSRELANSTHLAHSCSKGCSACCHLEVEITQDEGELLALLVLNGQSVDAERLKNQATRERNGDAWKNRNSPDNRCVFLDQNESCGVYESRPSVCRKALVTTPASFCSDPAMTPQPILIPLAELIISTALSLPDNPYTSISKSLTEGLARFSQLKERGRELVTDPGLELVPDTGLETPSHQPSRTTS